MDIPIHNCQEAKAKARQLIVFQGYGDHCSSCLPWYEYASMLFMSYGMEGSSPVLFPYCWSWTWPTFAKHMAKLSLWGQNLMTTNRGANRFPICTLRGEGLDFPWCSYVKVLLKWSEICSETSREHVATSRVRIRLHGVKLWPRSLFRVRLSFMICWTFV